MNPSDYTENLLNIVYMGMGEPLLNYNSLLKSIQLISSDSGLAMSQKVLFQPLVFQK